MLPLPAEIPTWWVGEPKKTRSPGRSPPRRTGGPRVCCEPLGVAGAQLVPRDVRALVVLRAAVVRQADARLRPDPHGQPRAVERVGPRRAPLVRLAELAVRLGHRDRRAPGRRAAVDRGPAAAAR